MDKVLIGKLIWSDNDIESFFEIINEKKDVIIETDSTEYKNKKEAIEHWAMWLNSPWSQTCEKYTIEVNCKDGYTEVEDKSILWRCIYKVIGYESITSTIIGYGATQQEALEDCLTLFDVVQKKYNPKGESI